MKKIAALIFLLLTPPVLAESKLDKAESLVLQTRYDEALSLLEEIEERSPRFYYNKMICDYTFFKKDAGLESANQLLKFDYLPDRYKHMARMIKYELENLREDSLDHVASLMKDSQRRLNLGHGGRKVQKVQAETVAILDYLIERIEQQNGGGGSDCPGETGKGQGQQSPQHAQDSSVKGSTAPGNVDPRNTAKAGPWGDLPPKEQARARQYAEDKFPPHYKKIIEEYSRKLAERKKLR